MRVDLDRAEGVNSRARWTHGVGFIVNCLAYRDPPQSCGGCSWPGLPAADTPENSSSDMNSSTTASHARIRSAAPKSDTNRTESWAFPNVHDVISPAKTSLRHPNRVCGPKTGETVPTKISSAISAFVGAGGGSGCANINVLTRVPPGRQDQSRSAGKPAREKTDTKE